MGVASKPPPHAETIWSLARYPLVGAFLLALLGVAAVAIIDWRARSNRRLTTQRFQTVALGLHHFHETFHELPHPSRQQWDDGERVFSWRGRIHPFVYHT